jgi:hypothetical protein
MCDVDAEPHDNGDDECDCHKNGETFQKSFPFLFSSKGATLTQKSIFVKNEIGAAVNAAGLEFIDKS